jgi:predicted NBD/HSP70 family sugar kinase
MDSESLLVIIIGGTWHRAALQKIQEGCLEPTFILEREGPRCITSILEFVEACVQLVNLESITGIVLGVPGYVQPSTGNVVLPPAYGPVRSYPLRSYLSKLYRKSVLIENDVNLQAWGEYLIRRREFASLSLVVVGTGVGSGHVIDNRLVRGSGGIAGEIGYLDVCFEGRLVSIRDLCAGGALDDHGFVKEFNSDVFQRMVVGLAAAAKAIALLLDPQILVFSGGVMSTYGLGVIEKLGAQFGAIRDPLIAPGFRSLRFELSSAGHAAAVVGAVGLYCGDAPSVPMRS